MARHSILVRLSVCTMTASNDPSKQCDCVALQKRIVELESQLEATQSQVEIQVQARTRDLQAVNHLLQRQSKTMLQHFACMSHEIR